MNIDEVPDDKRLLIIEFCVKNGLMFLMIKP